MVVSHMRMSCDLTVYMRFSSHMHVDRMYVAYARYMLHNVITNMRAKPIFKKKCDFFVEITMMRSFQQSNPTHTMDASIQITVGLQTEISGSHDE